MKKTTKQSLQRVYMPFGELVVGNHFILHKQHLVGKGNSPVFVKTNGKCYKDVHSGDVYLVTNNDRYSTWCSRVD